MALSENLTYESEESHQSEVESTRSGFSKLVKNVLEWGTGSAVASAAVNGIIAGVTGGVGAIIPAVIAGGALGLGAGSIVGAVQSAWRGLTKKDKH